MNNLIKVTILSISLLSGTGAFASTPTEQLGTCLVDSLNGKERNLLNGFIFLLALTLK